jgi:diaminopimelate epimerase
MVINILKCQGTGNDFILIDEISNNYNFTEEDRRKLAMSFCNRNKGIGADGILFVQNSKKCNAKMRIFNSDGSEPEMCGNGLRCVGRYVLELLEKDNINIETMKEEYNVKYLDDFFNNVKAVSIKINNICSCTDIIPIITEKKEFLFRNIEELNPLFKFSTISVSNPHLISIVDNIDVEILESMGKKANEIKQLFPEGINLSFVKILDDNSIYVKTYERGVGLTKSCGTGMMASTTVTCIHNSKKFDKELNVYNDGGMIKCKVTRENKDLYSAEFSGNATYMFRSEIDVKANNYDEFQIISNYDYEDETIGYDAFLNYSKKQI